MDCVVKFVGLNFFKKKFVGLKPRCKNLIAVGI